MDSLQQYTENGVPAQYAENFVNRDDWINWSQEQYIAYTAVGGLIPDKEGKTVAVKMSAETFAKKVGVTRQTLYNWRETIPNFWEKVAAVRRDLGSKERLSQVWNGVYLKAATGNPEAAKLYLANFDPNFRMPMQKVEHEAGDSLVEALGMARKRQQLIEGEVVNDTDQNT